MTRLKLLVSASAVLALTLAHAAFAADPAMKSDGMLVTHEKMTLYTFDKDPANAGKSVCNGPCAGNWPPLAAPADAKASGDWTVVKRDDGTNQWAYKGRPVYRWNKDQKPGDKTGDGVGGVWHVVKD